MKRIILFFTLFIAAQANAQLSVEEKLNLLFNPDHKEIFVAAHRGDWRNAPENSIPSLKNCIKMGVDIVELDLKRTKDGKLIIMHDHTIDRTTTGKGKPEDYTLEELKKFWLKEGTGHATTHQIPTLEEFLSVARDKVLLCIDKGFDYFEQAMELIHQKKMERQVIFNIPNLSLDSLNALQLKNLKDNLALNVIVSPAKSNVKNVISSFKDRNRTIIHPTFASDTIEFVKWMPNINGMGLKLWLNALWPEHNGGHDDDKAAYEDKPDETWGWLISHGANIIQTDRPLQLLQYLREKKLHL